VLVESLDHLTDDEVASIMIQQYRDHFLLKLGRPMLLAWAECNTECDRVGFIYNSSALVRRAGVQNESV
jgi:hypothetical protein